MSLTAIIYHYIEDINLWTSFLLNNIPTTVAVIKNSKQSFKIFDAHSRDLHGMPYSFGKCSLLTIEGIENLVSYLNISCLKIGFFPFEIKGVFVKDNEPDLQNVHKSPKIEHLPFRNKRNQTQHMKRKQKSLTETPEEKEKRVIAKHEYEKRRRVNESEESREKRPAQQRLTRDKKRANESSESRKKGVGKPNLSIKDKKLQMNQQNVERRDC